MSKPKDIKQKIVELIKREGLKYAETLDGDASYNLVVFISRLITNITKLHRTPCAECKKIRKRAKEIMKMYVSRNRSMTALQLIKDIAEGRSE